MPLPVCWLLQFSPFSLGYPNLHPSASTQLCHSFASFPHCRLGAGFTSVLQMLGAGKGGKGSRVVFSIMSLDGERASDVGLQIQAVSNETDQKTALVVT